MKKYPNVEFKSKNGHLILSLVLFTSLKMNNLMIYESYDLEEFFLNF